MKTFLSIVVGGSAIYAQQEMTDQVIGDLAIMTYEESHADWGDESAIMTYEESHADWGDESGEAVSGGLCDCTIQSNNETSGCRVAYKRPGRACKCYKYAESLWPFGGKKWHCSGVDVACKDPNSAECQGTGTDFRSCDQAEGSNCQGYCDCITKDVSPSRHDCYLAWKDPGAACYCFSTVNGCAGHSARCPDENDPECIAGSTSYQACSMIKESNCGGYCDCVYDAPDRRSAESVGHTKHGCQLAWRSPGTACKCRLYRTGITNHYACDGTTVECDDKTDPACAKGTIDKEACQLCRESDCDGYD